MNNQTDYFKEELEKRDKQLGLIKDVVEDIISELDFKQLLDSVATKAQSLIQAESLIIPIINKPGTEYSYLAACGKNAEIIIDQTFPIKTGMCGWVLSNQKSLLFGMESEWLMDEKTTWEAGMESAVLVPLKSRGQIVGGLSGLGKIGGGSFTQEDLELLSLFASHISVAIDNAQIFHELIEEKKLVETTLSSIGDAVITTDAEGRISRINPVAQKLIGRDAQESTGRLLSEVFTIVNAKTREPVSNPMETVLRQGGIISLAKHTILIARDGSEYLISDSAAPIRDEHGTIVGAVLVFHDVTDEYRLVEGLRQSEHKHRQLIDNLGDEYFFYIHDSEGVFTYVSPSITHVLGYSQEEFLVDYTTYLTDSPANKEVISNTELAIEGEKQPPYEVELFHKDGSIKILRVSESPVFDDKNNLVSVEGLAQDVTVHKRQEEALRRSQKLEAVDRLSSGIAHDFNNQLAVVIGYLDTLQLKANPNSPQSHWIDAATKAALRCTDLTRQLLAFSRNQARATTRVDINDSITQMKNMIARSVTPEVTVIYHLADDLGCALLDAGELQDAIINLVINARDAMPQGGELIIETASRTLGNDSEHTSSLAELTPGEYIVTSVSDTGCGMDQKTRERIFEPFFTTKSVGEGSGLGMAMVYGFVKRHDGLINVYSEQGAGTVIKIYLPLSAGDAEQPQEVQNDQQALPRGSESIIIVDDEVSLLKLAEHYLSDLGYTTYTAENGVQAMEILSNNQHIDLLFSDVVMPGGINGYELAKQAKELKPEIKLLLTSGFTSKGMAKSNSSKLSIKLLDKPYRRDALAKQIRHELDKE